jgi:hypothetical protein
MSPNDEPKSRKSKYPRIHWTQVKRAFGRVQGALPKDLGLALFHSLSAEGKEILNEFYQNDVLEIGKAGRSGNLSTKSLFKGQLGSLNPMRFRPSKLKAIATDAKSPLLSFFNQLGSDLAELKSPQDRAIYLIKVSTIFATTAFSLTTALRVATFGLAKNKFGKYPWIPSLGLVLGASALARLLDHASAHLEPGSKDQELAHFLKANLEIMAFGGSLGILDIPDFVNNPGSDPSLIAVQKLINQLMGASNQEPKLITE